MFTIYKILESMVISQFSNRFDQYNTRINPYIDDFFWPYVNDISVVIAYVNDMSVEIAYVDDMPSIFLRRYNSKKSLR